MTSFSNITFGGLVSKLSEEFGYTNSDGGFIRDKIREAYSSILDAKQVWPWLLAPFVVTTEASTTGTASVVSGSTKVGWPTPSLIGVNRIIQFGSDTNYYITINSSGDLDAPYAGASGSISFTAYRFGYSLPTDFSQIHEFNRQDSFTLLYSYRVPGIFFNLMRVDRTLRLSSTVFTVTKDRSKGTNDFMLYFDPIFDEVKNIRGTYVREYAKLDSLDDIPDIPGNDKIALYYEAAFRIAGSTRREGDIIAYYLKLREEHLKRLQSKYTYADTMYDDNHTEVSDPGMWRPINQTRVPPIG